MIEDVLTVMWKERKTILRDKASLSKFLPTLLFPIILNTVFPITWGSDWVTDFPPLVSAIIIPALLIAVMVPDSFAGERERHTLDTLLASRLPDRAIFFGKLVAPIVVGWGVALLLSLVSLFVVNVAHGEGELLLFTLPIAMGILTLSFLSSTTMAGAGVLTSLRSVTVQEAMQKLLIFITIPAVLVQVLPLLFREQFITFMNTVDGPQLLVIVIVVLIVIDIGIFAMAFTRFRRSRMYLD
jgi:ABC-2 type transport system permease protein